MAPKKDSEVSVEPRRVLAGAEDHHRLAQHRGMNGRDQEKNRIRDNKRPVLRRLKPAREQDIEHEPRTCEEPLLNHSQAASLNRSHARRTFDSSSGRAHCTGGSSRWGSILQKAGTRITT